MGTITAQILLGQNHPYEGGLLQVESTLYLTENGVARWTLYSAGDKKPVAGWIPTPETMLEDGLLLLGLHVWKDLLLLEHASQVFTSPLGMIDMLSEDTISNEDRWKLHRRCESILNGRNLVFTVLEGSSISKQLGIINKYTFEAEVCKTMYGRNWSVWTKSMDQWGSL
jgi:hypothetical protein